MMRSFRIHEKNGRFVIKSDHWDGFIAHAEPDTDAAAAQRMCDALNTGFRMGYSVGEADAQLAIRQALGVADVYSVTQISTTSGGPPSGRSNRTKPAGSRSRIPEGVLANST